MPGHPAVVDGDDADGGGVAVADVEEGEDVAGSAVRARELEVAARVGEEDEALRVPQGCHMAKFDPFLSLDCARVEGVGAQSKERKGSNFAA